MNKLVMAIIANIIGSIIAFFQLQGHYAFSDIKFAICKIFFGSFRFPLYGFGDR